jgi:ABC-type dipeptide/oligopeptide/nickel transport system ATPase component
MPKVSKVGKFRAQAATDKKQQNASLESTSASLLEKDDQALHKGQSSQPTAEQLSRGQRKRLVKREQYLKREKMILSSLRLKKLEEQKGKIDGLDALREALPMESKAKKSSAVTQEPVHVSNNKQKQAVAVQEVSHLNLVLQHPSFKSNPFATIQEHLRNTLADNAKQNETEYAKKKQKEDAIALKKKIEKKERLVEHKLATKGRRKRSKSRSQR